MRSPVFPLLRHGRVTLLLAGLLIEMCVNRNMRTAVYYTWSFLFSATPWHAYILQSARSTCILGFSLVFSGKEYTRQNISNRIA